MLLEMSELEGSIDSMSLNPKYADLVGESGDLPTPPFGIHPDLEGIYMRKLYCDRTRSPIAIIIW
jgi:hypothetical protein